MTEFKLNNGQGIELTKDGILIKGNRIEIDGSVTILKDDTHASIVEQNNEGATTSFEVLDEPKIMEPNPISYGKLVALEAKLSTAMTEIGKLKTTIKAEHALTDNKITDAIIKWTVNGK
ncbi:hypothetical protein N7X58_02065 [Leuconostoc mesenteroides]|uniref:hypothetical protein n=1 Tax=Leuconostoc mesenteroides TaxID=1245 RepID=UPI0021D3DA9C|nr:hypothetical protein [Leuconostoc mesenteroides]MCU4664281.1 hypothetical protein [Leuconostoc mesenteroides]